MTPDPVLVEDALNATIIDRQDLTGEISVIRVRPARGLAPDFLPGQFIKLGLPRGGTEAPVIARSGRERVGPRLVRRAYSIASSPRDRDALEFLLVRVQTGKLTPKIWTVDVGGCIWMDDCAAGRFTLEPVPPDKDIIMVATGTGVAPFVSMLRTHAGRQRWRRAVLVNGVRYAADLAYRDELETLARTVSGFHYLPMVSREPPVSEGGSEWRGLRGRVQQVLEPATFESLTGVPPVPRDCHVMLCGNPDMIVDVQRMLEAGGFRAHSPTQPGNLHFERYW